MTAMDGGERLDEGPAALARPRCWRRWPAIWAMPGSSRLARHRAFRWASASKVELTASPQAPLATLFLAGLRLRPDLLVVDSVQSSDASALGELLSAGARGVVAAGEAQAITSVPRRSVDLLASVGRLHGSFVAIEDATGTQLFVYQKGGRFQRRTATLSFAGTVHEAGYGEALSRALR